MSSGGELMLVGCNPGTLKETTFTYEAALFGRAGDSLTLLDGNRLTKVWKQQFRNFGATL